MLPGKTKERIISDWTVSSAGKSRVIPNTNFNVDSCKAVLSKWQQGIGLK